MQIPLSPAMERRLNELAKRTGKDVGEIVEGALSQVLERDLSGSEVEGRSDVPSTLGPRRFELFAALKILAAAFILAMIVLPLFVVGRTHLPSPNFWFDETGQYWMSRGLQHFSEPMTPVGTWPQLVEFGRAMNADPSGYTAALRFWIDIFGSSPAALRSLSFLFFLLIPMCVFLGARRCGANLHVAMLAATIPLALPMLLTYATELRAYSMEALAVAFLFFAPCWITVPRQAAKTVAAGCIAALLISSRYSAFLFAAAAGVAILFPLKPWRAALARAIQFGTPVLISTAVCYFLFAHHQLRGSYHAPYYVEVLLLKGKTSAEQLARVRENLLSPFGMAILVFILAALYWVRRGSLLSCDQRLMFARMAVYTGVSLVLTAAASALGLLPWAVNTRWSLGYQILGACCGSAVVIIAGIAVSRWAASPLRKWGAAVLAVGLALFWSVRLLAAVREERPYIETLGSHLAVLASSPNAKQLRFFVSHHSAPTARYLCEAGPFANAFTYPGNFHFESAMEEEKGTPISGNDFDVVVLSSQIPDATIYRRRVVDGSIEFRGTPWPSALLLLTRLDPNLRARLGAQHLSNLALSRPARQSSTYGTFGAERGVDGIRAEPGRFMGFHTANETNPWWEVDLGGVYDLAQIRLFNAIPYDRAVTFRVLLSTDDSGWKVAYDNARQLFDATPRIVDLTGQRARYVRVQLQEKSWLHLEEVEIYGVKP